MIFRRIRALKSLCQDVVLYLLLAESDPVAPRHGESGPDLDATDFDLHVIRPEHAGGRAAGQRVRLRQGFSSLAFQFYHI